MFSRLFRLGRATANDAVKVMEQGREVSLTEGDLEDLKKQRNQVRQSLAEIKANLVELERERAQKRETLGALERDIEALLGASSDDNLLQANAARAEQLDMESTELGNRIETQREFEREVYEKLEQLTQAIRTTENDLSMLRSMVETRKATEKARKGVAGVGGGKDALTRIQERKSKVQHELERARQLQKIDKEDKQDTLAEQTAAALGRTAGSKKLDDIRARMKAKAEPSSA
jgi:phage shock protein A